MQDITPTDLYWLAGWLEGEGSFGLHKHKSGYYHLRMQTGSTDIDILQKAQAITGYGTIISKKSKGITYKPAWEWTVASNQAMEIMNAILPIMGIRRSEKIRSVLEGAKEERLRGQINRRNYALVHGIGNKSTRGQKRSKETLERMSKGMKESWSRRKNLTS